jgi:hypothetical protein
LEGSAQWGGEEERDFIVVGKDGREGGALRLSEGCEGGIVEGVGGVGEVVVALGVAD